MPERMYMVVDGRRDHAFKVPRPDESVKFGTRNACTDCHNGRSAEWALKAVESWFGPSGASRPSFTAALHAGRSGWPEAGGMLARVAGDAAVPGIARATAVSLMRPQSTAEFGPVVERAAVDSDPLVRRAAAQAAPNLEAQAATRILDALLDDPIRTVRMEAVQAAAQAGAVPGARARFDRAAEEFRAAQRFNADRAEARVTLGAFDAALGRTADAEAEYRAAIRLQPQFAPSYVNLADLLRSASRETDAEQILREALGRVPEEGHAAIRHALGLVLVRQKRYAEAIGELRQAAAATPPNARFAFVYGVALHDTGQAAEARRVLEGAARRHPADPAILDALINYSLEAKDRASALKWAERLAAAVPADPTIARRVADLRGR
jgi:tetratricopeptide (TPR) repeat protein